MNIRELTTHTKFLHSEYKTLCFDLKHLELQITTVCFQGFLHTPYIHLIIDKYVISMDLNCWELDLFKQAIILDLFKQNIAELSCIGLHCGLVLVKNAFKNRYRRRNTQCRKYCDWEFYSEYMQLFWGFVCYYQVSCIIVPFVDKTIPLLVFMFGGWKIHRVH